MTRSTRPLPILIALLLPVVSACGDDGTAGPGDEAPATFDLSFTGDATFHGAHGGQDIHVFVQNSASSVVASDVGTVSDSEEEPAFSFTFTDALAEGEPYALKYWIDSNFGGGTEGECDRPEVDHQWRIAIDAVSADVTIDDTHRPAEVESVCSEGGGGTDPY